AGDTEFNTQGLLNGGAVTETTLGDKADALKTAYNELNGAAKGGTDVSSAADLADALNKLSKTKLDEVINKYNSTETKVGVKSTDDFKTNDDFDASKFTDDVATEALAAYQTAKSDATIEMSAF